jgi:hypothetical protein
MSGVFCTHVGLSETSASFQLGGRQGVMPWNLPSWRGAGDLREMRRLEGQVEEEGLSETDRLGDEGLRLLAHDVGHVVGLGAPVLYLVVPAHAVRLDEDLVEVGDLP